VRLRRGATMSDNPKFSPDEQQILRIIVGHIIPASAQYGMPGADDDAIFADILHAARREEKALREAIAVVGQMADGRLGGLAHGEQAELLGRFRSTHPLLARAC